MKNFLDKFFSRSKNLDYISQNLKQITLTTPANKIFEAINNYSEKSEIRYVGGCVRKVIKKENVDDIVKMMSWNKMKIKVLNENITTWINGKKMIQISDSKIGKGNGSIALQIHDGGGIKVRWRNIIVKEID